MAPEPFPLREPERRTIHVVHDAQALLAKWENEETPVRWKNLHRAERDVLISRLDDVRDKIQSGEWNFTEPDTYERVPERYQHNLGACRGALDNLSMELRGLISEEFPESPTPRHIADKVLSCVIVTHVLGGHIQDAHGKEGSPLVYCCLDKSNRLKFRTWVGRISEEQVALFSVKSFDMLGPACLDRYNEVAGARFAIFNGDVSSLEAHLTDKCIYASRALLDASRRLGYVGNTTSQLVGQTKNLRSAARARVLPMIQQFRIDLGGADERFSDDMISRAAASMNRWRGSMVAIDDSHVCPYIYDYCMQYGDTSTWDPQIIVHAKDGGPSVFPAQWRIANHRGPFPANRGILPLDLGLADLPNLVSLSLVASQGLDKHSVAPADAVESEAKIFYGDFVDSATFDLTHPPDTVFYGMPICTKEFSSAMSLVYAGYETLPPVPRMFQAVPAPLFGANDCGRNIMRAMYVTFYDDIKNGGLKAFNAITQQTMKVLHELLVAPEFDILRATEITGMLAAWLWRDNPSILDVTTANSLLSQDEIDNIVASQRRPDRPEDDPGVALPARLRMLRRVDFSRGQLVEDKVVPNKRWGNA